MDVKKLMAEGSLDNLSEDLFKSVSSYSEEVKAFQRQKAAEYADQVVAALKKIEQDIKDRYDRVGLNLEKRVLNIKDGKDGINGRDGRDGKDGKPGAAGLPGRDGKDGKNGRDGVDGKDGVSVVNAFLDFDNSLVIELSNGKQVNAGAILGADFAEKVKIIANGGGTSQGVIDTLASLQAQISAISSLGAVSYQGTWNASTNTPTITASVGTKGYYYVVSVAGTTSINGESKWGVGDWIVFNGSTWQKVDGGSTGNLTTLDVSSSASIGGALTLSAYSGNTIPYLNGSSVINAGSALSFDGTNLGIGLASPSRQLTVYGSSPYIALQNSTTGATSGDGLQIQMAGGEAYIWNYENNFLSFGTNITERMRIAGNGDISLNGGTANGVAYLNGSKVVTTGSALTFDGTAFSTTGTINAGTAAKAYRIANWTLAGYSGNTLQFGNATTSGEWTDMTWSLSGSEQMRLTSTGLGIGTSSPDVLGLSYGEILGISSASSVGLEMNAAFGSTSNIDMAVNGTRRFQAEVGNSAVTLKTRGAVPLLFGTDNTERMRLDASGNLGLGVTPSAWASGWNCQQVGYSYSLMTASISTAANAWYQMNNAYYDGTFKYKNNGSASSYEQGGTGNHVWKTAASGTAGNAISFTQAMTLDASGNLGIGTSSPGAKLDVDAGNPTVVNFGGVTVTGQSSGIRFRTGSTKFAWYVGAQNNVNNVFEITPSTAAGGTTFSTPAIQIDSSGNLGLGVTPSAWATLKAFDVGTYTGVAGGNGYTHISNNAYLSTYASTWTYKNTNNASLYSMDSGTHKWYTAPSGTAGNAISFTQVMTLDASGNLLVGTTGMVSGYDLKMAISADSGTNKWGIGPRVALPGTFYVAANTTYGVYLSSTTATSWASASDERVKTDLQPIENAAEKVCSLRAVTGRYTADDSGVRKAFLIAQDVLAVLPEAVDTTNPEKYGLAYTDTIPLLVAAIKEQQALITQLKARLDAANL